MKSVQLLGCEQSVLGRCLVSLQCKKTKRVTKRVTNSESGKVMIKSNYKMCVTGLKQSRLICKRLTKWIGKLIPWHGGAYCGERFVIFKW